MTSGTFFQAFRHIAAGKRTDGVSDLAHILEQDRSRQVSRSLDQNTFYSLLAYGLAMIAAGAILIVAVMI
jgi:hypothetical protein